MPEPSRDLQPQLYYTQLTMELIPSKVHSTSGCFARMNMPHMLAVYSLEKERT